MRENVNGILKVVPTDDSGAPLVGISGVAAGAAGSPNADVLSVQGVAGMTPIVTDGDDYETVAASQTAQVMGATGAAGDYLAGVLIVPAAAAAGAVSILDGATSITIFAGGGTTPLADLKPFFVKVGAVSVNGAWKLTTGANVSAIGLGDFT